MTGVLAGLQGCGGPAETKAPMGGEMDMPVGGAGGAKHACGGAGDAKHACGGAGGAGDAGGANSPPTAK